MFTTQVLNFRLWIPVLIIGIYTACSPTPSTSADNQAFEESAIAVRGTQIEPTTAPIPVLTSGKVAAGTETHLAVKIGGIIERLHADEGDIIRKGQVLARIAQPEIGAQVTQAQSGLDKATRDLERATRLYADTVITLEQLQNLQTAKEVATAQVRQASASVGYANLYAPATGKVLKRMAERGEFAAAGTPLFIIETQEAQGTVRAGLVDREMVRVQEGDTAQIVLDAYPNKVFKGLVRDKGEVANPQTGLFEVEMSLDDEGFQVLNGFVAKIHIYPLKQEAYYRIPVDAIVESEAQAVSIYVPGENLQIAKKQVISQYTIVGEFMLVPAAQLPELDYVITEGARYLSAGDSIRLLDVPVPTGIATLAD